MSDFIVKVILVLFISVIAFATGTFIGKQVADSDYRRSLQNEHDVRSDR